MTDAAGASARRVLSGPRQDVQATRTMLHGKWDVPCAPVMSMKEIAEDKALRESGTVLEVEQKGRGTYLTVGSPIKFSGFIPEIKGAPLLGEHTDEVLADLGYDADTITDMHAHQVVA
ncbi:CoA transferase [Streptomyces sp. NPDC001156]